MQLFQFMTDEQRQKIHDASLDVLENTGLLVHYEKARDILKNTVVSWTTIPAS